MKTLSAILLGLADAAGTLLPALLVLALATRQSESVLIITF